MSLQISEKVKELGRQAQEELKDQFARIDAIAEENAARVLDAFQTHRVADAYFAGTTATATTTWAGTSWTRSTPRSSAPRPPWYASSSSTVPTLSPPPCTAV